MTNKNDLKKESNQLKQTSCTAADEVVGKSTIKLKPNQTKDISRWNNLAYTVSINAYD